jgi:prepilin-type processing-associated H-X9-DG protein
MIIGDSIQDIIALPSSVALTPPATYTTYQGFNSGAVNFMPYITSATTGDDFTIDSRHMKPGTPKKAALTAKTINGLFCDGHAETVNVRQAFNAIRNPGKDSTN